jgi:hypothetical protein
MDKVQKPSNSEYYFVGFGMRSVVDFWLPVKCVAYLRGTALDLIPTIPIPIHVSEAFKNAFGRITVWQSTFLSNLDALMIIIPLLESGAYIIEVTN